MTIFTQLMWSNNSHFNEHIEGSDQNGVSLLYIIVGIHHSGRKPSICIKKKKKRNVLDR